MPADLPLQSSLQADDFAALDHLREAGDPRFTAIRQKMRPDEVSAYIQHLSKGANDTATNAGIGLGLGAAGAGALSEIPAVAKAGAQAWPYVKYGATASAINYLPVPGPVKTALETMLGLKAMKSNMGGAEAAPSAEDEIRDALGSPLRTARASGRALPDYGIDGAAPESSAIPSRAPSSPPLKALDFKDMGGMSDEEVRAAIAGGRQAPSHTLTTPQSGVRLRTPNAGPVTAPSDIEQRTRPDWLTQDVAPGPFANPNAHVLRPDESLIGLIRERYPDLSVSALKVPPVPEGADPLSKAIRQRKHIGDAVNRYSMPHGVTPTTDDLVQQLNKAVKRREPK